MAGTIPTPIAATAIVVSAAGSSLISLLILYLFMRRRRPKRRAHEEETQVSAAADRPTLSYAVKGQPSLTKPLVPSPQEQRQRPERTMTNAIIVPAGPPRPRTQLSPRAEEPRGFIRRTQSARTETGRPSNRNTASPPLTDSAQQVYADILAQPLEHVASPPSPEPAELTPAARRDDVGWPLCTKQDVWL